MTTPVERLSGLVVGVVESVAPDEIRILLELDAPHSTALNTGVPAGFPRLNGYLLIPNEAGATVAYITWIGIERSPYPKRAGLKDFGLIDLPFPLRKMSLSPVGTLTSRRDRASGTTLYELCRGVVAFPSVGDQVLIPTPSQVEAIVGARDDDKRVRIGSSPMASNAAIMVDPENGGNAAGGGERGKSGWSCANAVTLRGKSAGLFHENALLTLVCTSNSHCRVFLRRLSHGERMNHFFRRIGALSIFVLCLNSGRSAEALPLSHESPADAVTRSHSLDPDDHWDDRFGWLVNFQGVAVATIGADVYAAGTFPDEPGPVKVLKWGGERWIEIATVNTSLVSLAVLGSDLYLAGNFSSVSGVNANNVAKWDGVNWSPLGAGTNGSISSLAVLGTDLYAVGSFSTAGGVSAANVAKWDGISWSALGGGLPSVGLAVTTIGSDVYAGGSFTGVRKWDGISWTTFGGIANVSSLAAVGPDLYAGGADSVRKKTGLGWTTLGSLDGDVHTLHSFGADLFVGGVFSTAGGVGSRGIARWDGSSWSALGTGVNGAVWAIGTNGVELFAAGNFVSAGGAFANGIAKWDGASWSRFGPAGLGMNAPIYAVAVIGTDLYAAGDFTIAGAAPANRIAKWDGISWTALGTGMNDSVWDLAVIGTDLYAGGSFTTAGGISANYIAKWDGTSWSPLGQGMNSAIEALGVVGNDLYASGPFTLAGGVSAQYIAKWNGIAWSAVGSGLNGVAYALATIGTDLYAGGQFTSAGGTSAHNIARWNGATWSALGTGLNNYVLALASSGSDLFVGGEFSVAGGVSAIRIAKWDGGAWSALGAGIAGGGVGAVTVAGTDLYVGGGFDSVDGIPAQKVAKWSGGTWSELGSGINGYVSSLTTIGSNLYVGGQLNSAGNKDSSHIALYHAGACGNGDIDSGETCDPAAENSGACCNADTCQLAPAGTKCRAKIGACDAEEICDGIAASCPDDELETAGTVCRADGCLTSQTCTGVGQSCPAGIVMPAGTICRSATSDCDVIDQCDGIATACPNDSVEPAGSPCGDPTSNDCIAPDICSTDGVCLQNDPADGTPCGDPASTLCDAPDTCADGVCVQNAVPRPSDSCLLAPTTKLQAQSDPDSTKNKLMWSWSKGAALEQGMLGTPDIDTTYSVCVYDASGGVFSLAAALELPPSPLWITKDPKGYKYSDRTGIHDGIGKLQLKTGAAGKSKAMIKAAGLSLPLAPTSASMFFSTDPSVVVQLVSSDGLCLTSDFTSPLTNDGSRYKASNR